MHKYVQEKKAGHLILYLIFKRRWIPPHCLLCSCYCCCYMFLERKLEQGVVCVARPATGSIAMLLVVWEQHQTVQTLYIGGKQGVCRPNNFVWWALWASLVLMRKDEWFQACICPSIAWVVAPCLEFSFIISLWSLYILLLHGEEIH